MAELRQEYSVEIDLFHDTQRGVTSTTVLGVPVAANPYAPEHQILAVPSGQTVQGFVQVSNQLLNTFRLDKRIEQAMAQRLRFREDQMFLNGFPGKAHEPTTYRIPDLLSGEWLVVSGSSSTCGRS